MSGDLNYDYDFDPADGNSTAAAVYGLAKGHARILDLGSGPAVVSSRLAREDGAEVVCVDTDEPALEAAKARGVTTTIFRDLVDPSWVAEVAGRPYGCIILADVLEHIYTPRTIIDLIMQNGLLAEDGVLVISVPNATHEAVIGSLAAGDFEYQDRGSLDATHIRWFTLRSMRRMLEECGMGIVSVTRIERTLEQTTLNHVLTDLDFKLRKTILEAVPDSRVYQYVLAVRPLAMIGGAVGLDLDAERVRQRAFDARAIADLQAKVRAAEDARDAAQAERDAADAERDATHASLEAAAAGLGDRIGSLERLIRFEREHYVAEQQRAAAALNEADARAQSLTRQVTELRERVATLKDRTLYLKERLVAVKARALSLKDQTLKLKGQTAKLQDESVRLNRELRRYKGTVERIRRSPLYRPARFWWRVLRKLRGSKSRGTGRK